MSNTTTWSQRLTKYANVFGNSSEWDKFDWNPNEDDKGAASELHTQLISRIATQPLSYQDGIETSALHSLYQLFDKTRAISDKYSEAGHFHNIAWYVLNHHVRPFTARWHPRSDSGALAALDATDDFRSELRRLQVVLKDFDGLLLAMCGRNNLPEMPALEYGRRLIREEMSRPVVSGISCIRGGLDENDVAKLNDAEREAILARRNQYGPTYAPEPCDPSASGLALSGGGIRAATFSLGVLVSLARRGLLPQFDYLSTVSGGGYLGSFITSFISHSPGAPTDVPADQIGLKPDQLPFRQDGGEAAALRHIRHHSRYLQASFLERLGLGVAQLFGILVNWCALATIPAFGAIIEYQLRPWIDESWPTLNRGWAILSLLTGGAVFLLALARVSFRLKQAARVGLSIIGLLTITLLTWRALGYLHTRIDIFPTQPRIRDTIGAATLALVGALPIIAAILVVVIGRRQPRTATVLGMIAGLAVPVMLLDIELVTFARLHDPSLAPFWLSGPKSHPAWISVLIGVTLLSLNINFTSLHDFYRRKLATVFMIRPAAHPTASHLTIQCRKVYERVQDFFDKRLSVGKKNAKDSGTQRMRADNHFDVAVKVKLSESNLSAKGPYHLINAALNVPGSKSSAMQGRRTDFFLFSQNYCGSPLTGYQATKDWEKCDRSLDLSSAMAISGAAASPLMGLTTRSYMSFWMTLLNIRLGYWLRKPNQLKKVAAVDAPGISYLFREMFSSASERGRYLNITDGGHIENLGVYELLRRRCKYIVAIDGEHDPAMTFNALATLQRLAAIDLNTKLDIDLDNLRLKGDGLSRSHFEFCRVLYPASDRDDAEIGYLLYVKLSLTGNEGEFIRRYRLDEPEFPHHSTANQFFTEAQFEAYRSLGEHVGDKLFIEAIAGKQLDKPIVPIAEWFGGIGEGMLSARDALPLRANELG